MDIMKFVQGHVRPKFCFFPQLFLIRIWSVSVIYQAALAGRQDINALVFGDCHVLFPFTCEKEDSEIQNRIVLQIIMVNYCDKVEPSNKQTVFFASPCIATLLFMFMYYFFLI